MKKLLLFSFLVIVCFSNLKTQAQRTCASYEVFQQQLQSNPLFAKKQQEIEAFTQNFIRKGGSRALNNFVNGKGTPVYTIPVVVHVVWKTAEQNISEAQVLSQIDVLNKDYQLLNADTGLIPSVFKPLTADCKIQFCMAQRDPNGNPTNGIVRKQTTKSSFSTNDAVKHSSQGGDDAWPADQYLNLWVCNLGQGLLGYAQFPGGNPATDGVVILYKAFGNTGTLISPYDKGRTATHEVGHWLNLRHIWGDDNSACTGSDQVGDTPNQGGPNYGCPSFPHVSCNNGPNGDMFMNYMDYVDDGCMQMFSLGQKDRMYAVLQPGGARYSITTSQGCSPATGGGCATPPGISATNITASSATISWSSVTGAVSYDLKYQTSDSAYTISGITTTSYTLTNLFPNTTYNYSVRTNCSSQSSAYSAIQTFTTLSNTSCTDNYEPNNTKGTAKAIPVNINITGLISPSGDVDFYKFTTTAGATNIKITLTNLPKDYDLKLFNASGTLLAKSQKAGTSNETIVYNTSTKGTYGIQVYGYRSANDALNCYTLLASTSGTAFKEDFSSKLSDTKGIAAVYPQPASSYINIQFEEGWKGSASLTVINQLGVTLMNKQINVETPVYKLDVSSLKSGVYYIKITNQEETITHKIVVQH